MIIQSLVRLTSNYLNLNLFCIALCKSLPLSDSATKIFEKWPKIVLIPSELFTSLISLIGQKCPICHLYCGRFEFTIIFYDS